MSERESKTFAVELVDGQSREVVGHGWEVGGDGGLHIYRDGKDQSDTVATFAAGRWSAIVDAERPKLSVGSLTVAINVDDTGLRKWAEDLISSRASDGRR